MTEKPLLSIILAAIRQSEWDRHYDSLKNSTKKSFELIICSPKPLTEYLQNKNNVKYVKDYGSPSRAYMIASSLAEGELITWSADDAIYNPGSLDVLIDNLLSMPKNIKNVSTGKYTEGRANSSRAMHIFSSDSYYKINGGDDIGRPCTSSKYLPDDWYIFNAAVMYREYFEYLGGIDCGYEHAAMADTDLAIRAQLDGAIVKLDNVIVYDCVQFQEDHVSVDSANLDVDIPKIQNKYQNPEWKKNINIRLNISEWKNFPSVWKRRFGDIL